MDKLDKYGCDFGRQNREIIHELTVKMENAAVRCDVTEDKLEKLEEEMKRLDDRLDKMEARLAWVLGVAAASGAILGSLFSKAFAVIFKVKGG